MNIPNTLSATRIILIPLFLYLIFIPDEKMRFGALIVFLVASLTDLLDGWSARKLDQITDTGKFLDPLADKFLVVSAFLAFLILDPLVPFWMILIIIARDILLTFMRYLAIKKGMNLRTTRFGKIKTGFQMISIIVIIMVLIVRSQGGDFSSQINSNTFLKLDVVYKIFNSDLENKWLIIAPYCLMAIVTILTALSGFRYLVTNRKLFLPPSLEKKDRDS